MTWLRAIGQAIGGFISIIILIIVMAILAVIGAMAGSAVIGLIVVAVSLYFIVEGCRTFASRFRR